VCVMRGLEKRRIGRERDGKEVRRWEVAYIVGGGDLGWLVYRSFCWGLAGGLMLV
jgi:hypothetical protein